jgi:ArsR family transcriptional regulator
MKTLCDCGLVTGRRDGAWMRYTINMEVFESVKELFGNLGFYEKDVGKEESCLTKCK